MTFRPFDPQKLPGGGPVLKKYPRERKRQPKRARATLPGRDFASLDPALRSVAVRDMRCPRDLRPGDDDTQGDWVQRVPGYPYGRGEVVDMRPARAADRTIITIDYPQELHGTIEVEIGDDDRLEVYDPDEVEAP